MLVQAAAKVYMGVCLIRHATTLLLMSRSVILEPHDSDSVYPLFSTLFHLAMMCLVLYAPLSLPNTFAHPRLTALQTTYPITGSPFPCPDKTPSTIIRTSCSSWTITAPKNSGTRPVPKTFSKASMILIPTHEEAGRRLASQRYVVELFLRFPMRRWRVPARIIDSLQMWSQKASRRVVVVLSIHPTSHQL